MIEIAYHAGGMRDLPIEKVVQVLADTGYDSVEMMCGPEAHIPSGQVTDKLLGDMKALVESHGLTVCVINPFTGPDLLRRAFEDMQKAIDHYSLLQDVAVALDARGVNFLTGYGGEKGDAQAWKTLVDVLRPLCRRAETLGLTMNIHNHESQTIDTPDKVDLLIRHVGSPALRPLIDITNFYHLGGDIAEVTQRLGAAAAHCHVKGVRGMYPYSEFLIPGEEGDELDFGTFADALGRSGFSGAISVESFPHMRMEKARIAYDMIASHLIRLGLRSE